MVRPKKTPASSTMTRNKSKAQKQTAASKISEVNSDSDSQELEFEKSNTDSNNENLKMIKTTTASRSASRKSSPSKASAAPLQTTVDVPRKRRIASLNAEFLVHYTSNTNKQHQQEAAVKSDLLKRKRTNSEASTAKPKRKLATGMKTGLRSRGRPRKTDNTKRRKTAGKADTLTGTEECQEEDPLNTIAQEKLDALQMENYAKILSDFAVQEGDELDQTSEENEDKKTETKNFRKTAKKAISRRGRGKQKTTAIKNDQEVENLEKPVTNGRPKREAGIRASAMIIQTNEIEKTNYQYHYSNSNPATPTASQLHTVTSLDPPATKLKTSQSFSNFQMPHFPSIAAYTSFANAVAAADVAAQFSKPNFNSTGNSSSKTTAAEAQKTQNNKSNQSKHQANIRQVSTTATLGNVSTPVVNGGDEESSIDVLIIESPSNKSSKQPAVKSAEILYPTLTEDLIKEHNKKHDSGSGNGTFSSSTRDYIIRWVAEYKMTDAMPFLDSEVPLESYGKKILNQPQYLMVKARQEGKTVQVPPKLGLTYSYVSNNQKTAQRSISTAELPQSNTEKMKSPLLIKPETHEDTDKSKINEATSQKIVTSDKLVKINQEASLNYKLKVPELGKSSLDHEDTSNNNNNNNNIAGNINYFPNKCISAS